MVSRVKSPFVRRSRLESKLARASEAIAELRDRVQVAEEAANEADESARLSDQQAKLAEQTAATAQTEATNAEKQRQELERIRADELKWLQEVESIAEIRSREIETLRSQLAAAEFAHSAVLAELAVKSTSPTTARTDCEPETSPGNEWSIQREPDHDAAIPVILGIDFEPDKREVDLEDPSWQGAVDFLEQLPDLRHRLNRSTDAGNAPLTWFVRADPQIERSMGNAAWALEQFAEHWRESNLTGDEVGLHMHPWRWDDQSEIWYQDHDDEAWIQNCLTVAFGAYRDFFGKAPTSYRGGDRFLSNSVRQRIEEEGVRVDLGVEHMPGVARLVQREHGSGHIPDCRRAPRHAYWPADADFRMQGAKRSSGFGIVPLTSYAAGTLTPWALPEDFEHALAVILAERSMISHLAFVVRTDLVRTNLWGNFCRNLETLAGMATGGEFEFMPATAAWSRAQEWLVCEAV